LSGWKGHGTKGRQEGKRVMFQEYLKRIIERGDLAEDEMAEAMDLIFSGQCTDAQIGALMADLCRTGGRRARHAEKGPSIAGARRHPDGYRRHGG